MTRYSVEAKDEYLTKVMDFYLLLTIWVKILVKVYVKT